MPKLRKPTRKLDPSPLPRGVTDETGHSYGRLVVLSYAGQLDGKAAWACECECGAACTVRGDRMRSGRAVSCGCSRSDPAIRQAARMKLSASRRVEIAKMGAKARRAKART